MIQSQTWEFGNMSPWAIAMIAGISLLVLLAVWLERRRGPRLAIATLITRTMLVAWLSLVVFEFAMWQIRLEPKPGNYTILVDQSASVTLRPELSKQIIDSANDLHDQLVERGNVTIMTYNGRGAETTWQSGFSNVTPGGPTWITQDLARLPAEALNKNHTLVLLSDGADHGLSTQGPTTGSVAAVILPQAEHPPSPLMIVNVESDAYALVRSPLRFSVTVARSNLATPRSAQVRIFSAGTQLGITDVTFAARTLTANTTLDILPTQEGRQVFTIEVHHDNVSFNPAFQETRMGVRVIRDRIRILHVVGRPGWETRLLRENLRRDPAVDLVSFQILRTTGDNPAARNEELSLIPFPTKELFTVELPKFDVVFFQNFNYAPYFEPQFRNTLLANLRNFVMRDGGGFAMTAGDLSFGYGGYHMTPVRDILPVTWRGLGQWQEDVTQLQPGEHADWFGAPPPGSPMISRVYQARIKDHARVVWQSGESPAFAVGTVGQGRTAALLTDQLWRLAYQGTPADRAAIAGFWSRLVRYLSGDPEFEDIHVDWDRPDVHPGAPARGALSPATGNADIIDEHGKLLTTLDTGKQVLFEAPQTGASLRVRTPGGIAPEPLIVQYPLEERTHLQIDRIRWQRWAERHGATVSALENWRSSNLVAQLRARSEHVTQREFVEIQRFWWYWLIGLLLLAGEIAVRRLLGAA